MVTAESIDPSGNALGIVCTGEPALLAEDIGMVLTLGPSRADPCFGGMVLIFSSRLQSRHTNLPKLVSRPVDGRNMIIDLTMRSIKGDARSSRRVVGLIVQVELPEAVTQLEGSEPPDE